MFPPAVTDDEIDHEESDESQKENADDQNIEKNVIYNSTG
jgi:hypothetical protein